MRAGKTSGLEDGILQLVKQENGAKPSVLAERLGGTRSEVQYALRKMVKEGRLRRVGKSTDPETKYVAV